MNINVNSLSSPSRGRLFYGRYRSQRAEESRRRRFQLAAIGVACVVAALLTFSLIARLFGSRRPSWCSQPAPMVCAHGGDISAGLANTMPAYRAALAHPAVKCVEVDVSRTRDDILVALHQRQLLTISDGEHESVGDARLDQLKWFGAQDEGMRVLTLQEALSALMGKGLETIILDIKDGPPFGADGFASMSLDAIEVAQCKECIVWAKEDVVVAEVVSRGLGAKAGFVLMNETAEARDRGMNRMGRIQGASILAVHWGMVDEQLVAAARGHKLRVFGWTANTVSMIDPLIRAGVAAIVTDQPTLVQQRLQALRAACKP